MVVSSNAIHGKLVSFFETLNVLQPNGTSKGAAEAYNLKQFTNQTNTVKSATLPPQKRGLNSAFDCTKRSSDSVKVRGISAEQRNASVGSNQHRLLINPNP